MRAKGGNPGDQVAETVINGLSFVNLDSMHDMGMASKYHVSSALDRRIGYHPLIIRQLHRFMHKSFMEIYGDDIAFRL